MIQKAHMEILHVYFAIYMFWNCTLWHPLLWTCNLPCSVYQNQIKTTQKSLSEVARTSGVSVHWLLGKFKCLRQSQ